MAKTRQFEEFILQSFFNKFIESTTIEQVTYIIIDPMIIQIINKNRKEKFFTDKDEESIELLKIILAGEKVFV